MGTVSLLRDDQYIDGCKSLFTFFQKMITEVFKETCVSVFRSVTRCFCIHGGFGHITRKLFPSPGLHSQELCFSLIPVPLKEEMYLVLMFWGPGGLGHCLWSLQTTEHREYSSSRVTFACLPFDLEGLCALYFSLFLLYLSCVFVWTENG